ncbi:hypothetical protein [Paenibacillus pini]|uniref:Uncharacterized protein n=1 Tax=Paenibacillus pini JCM 16418 TaxID=1236976 RepID=W7YWP8_9BACL|nr:hypothetical protein [Paenibacillus pini]GAF06799.1 hypothetical protein JCM16418_781 [Paenibacillus pini JCM 16418]
MGQLKPISKADKRMSDFSITIDKSDRICLNANLRKELGLIDKVSMYLFYDEDGRRIGISKQCEDESILPFTFDSRGYTSARGFLSWCEYDTTDGAIRLIFDGMESDTYVFRETGRLHNAFKQAKNGDLERC